MKGLLFGLPAPIASLRGAARLIFAAAFGALMAGLWYFATASGVGIAWLDATVSVPRFRITVAVAAALMQFVIGWRGWREAKRLKANEVWLRDALRARDAAEREPTRIAFQAGYQLGLQSAGAAFEIQVACDCPRCRADRWAVN